MFDTWLSLWSSRQQRWIHWLALLMLCLLLGNLYCLGAQPVAVELFPSPWDKLAHFGLFAVLAMLIALSLSGCLPSLRWLMGISFMLGVALGALDEGRQMYLPGREAGLDDLFADALGAAFGLWCIRYALRALLYGDRGDKGGSQDQRT